MIATWMGTSTLFALLLGVSALALERALRTVERQGRGAWFVALLISVIWPFAALLLAFKSPLPDGTLDAVVLPTVQSAIAVVTASLPIIPVPWIDRLDGVLLAVWAIASLVILVRLMMAVRALARVEHSATREVIDGVSVFVTPAVGPAVFGLRRLRFLMPKWLLDLDQPLQHLVMQHEREHGRARDPQLTLIAAVGVALVPWNPAVWWIARRLRLAIELDCDARVLRANTNRERYARLLVFIAQRQSRNSTATMLAESTSTLSRRIARMHMTRPRFARIRVVALVAAAAFAASCSGKVGSDLATNPTTGGAVASAEVSTFYSPEGAIPATLIEHPVLWFPAALRNNGLKGEVLAMFIVDTSGRVAPGSLKIVRSTDSLFTQSVRAVVAGMRFNPPQLNGKNVRQLVQQSFIFDESSSSVPPSAQIRPTTDPTNRNPMTLKPIKAGLR
jgi:TonB family protein